MSALKAEQKLLKVSLAIPIYSLSIINDTPRTEVVHQTREFEKFEIFYKFFSTSSITEEPALIYKDRQIERM